MIFKFYNSLLLDNHYVETTGFGTVSIVTKIKFQCNHLQNKYFSFKYKIVGPAKVSYIIVIQYLNIYIYIFKIFIQIEVIKEGFMEEVLDQVESVNGTDWNDYVRIINCKENETFGVIIHPNETLISIGPRIDIISQFQLIFILT